MVFIYGQRAIQLNALSTKVMLQSALAFCSAHANSQGQFTSVVVYNVENFKFLMHVHLDKASYCMHLLQVAGAGNMCIRTACAGRTASLVRQITSQRLCVRLVPRHRYLCPSAFVHSLAPNDVPQDVVAGCTVHLRCKDRRQCSVCA